MSIPGEEAKKADYMELTEELFGYFERNGIEMASELFPVIEEVKEQVDRIHDIVTEVQLWKENEEKSLHLYDNIYQDFKGEAKPIVTVAFIMLTDKINHAPTTAHMRSSVILLIPIVKKAIDYYLSQMNTKDLSHNGV